MYVITCHSCLFIIIYTLCAVLCCAVIDLNDIAFVICLIENEDFHLDFSMWQWQTVTPFPIRYTCDIYMRMRAVCMYIVYIHIYIYSIPGICWPLCTFGIQECDLCISHYSVGAKHDDKIEVSWVLCKMWTKYMWMWIHVCPLLIVTYATKYRMVVNSRLALGVSDILFRSFSIKNTFKTKKWKKERTKDRKKSIGSK